MLVLCAGYYSVINVVCQCFYGYNHPNKLLTNCIMLSLKEWREERCISQLELAELAGVTEATVIRLEKRRHKPNYKTRRKLAKALKVKPNEIEF